MEIARGSQVSSLFLLSHLEEPSKNNSEQLLCWHKLCEGCQVWRFQVENGQSMRRTHLPLIPAETRRPGYLETA